MTMCRKSAGPPRISWRGPAYTIAALLCLVAAEQAARGRTLFLLAGTCFLNDTSATFPASSYTVNAQRRLTLFRTVVSGSEGTTDILDSMQGQIYATFPSNLGAHGLAPTKVSIIHERHPGEDDVVTFNRQVMLGDPYSEATAAGPGLNSYALFVLFPQPPSSVNTHAAFMRFLRSSATILVAVAGNPPASGPRVTRNEWSLYSHLTFSGSPGGPGAYPTPEAVVEDGNLVMRYGGGIAPVDQAPALPEGSPALIWILAANSRFVVSAPLHFDGGNYSVPAILHVHDRVTEAWKKLASAGSMPQCRIFGPWLATRVRNLKRSDRYRDTSPGHNDERPEVRLQYLAMDSGLYIPGALTLDNLVDGRRITLQTREEDSEILAVRSDGLVLYRVNDEIFSAQVEGDKLSAPTLVVKGEDVPEIHWAFWSNAEVEAQPPARPPAGR